MVGYLAEWLSGSREFEKVGICNVTKVDIWVFVGDFEVEGICGILGPFSPPSQTPERDLKSEFNISSAECLNPLVSRSLSLSPAFPPSPLTTSETLIAETFIFSLLPSVYFL